MGRSLEPAVNREAGPIELISQRLVRDFLPPKPNHRIPTVSPRLQIRARRERRSQRFDHPSGPLGPIQQLLHDRLSRRQPLIQKMKKRVHIDGGTVRLVEPAALPEKLGQRPALETTLPP